MKCIYCLFDAQDLWNLMEFCQSQNLSIFASNGSIINSKNDLFSNSDIISFYICPKGECPPLKQAGKYYWIPDDVKGVYVNKTLISESGLYTSGMICLDGENANYALIYSKLNRYVKGLYHRSWNAQLYVAPEMYQKWCSRQVSFHFFVDAEYFDVQVSSVDFSNFVRSLNEKKIQIAEDGRDIRFPAEYISPNAKEFFIHTPDAKTHTWVRSRKLYYFTDSEGVFLYTVKKKGVLYYRFIADQRFFVESATENSVPQLFFTAEHMTIV